MGPGGFEPPSPDPKSGILSMLNDGPVDGVARNRTPITCSQSKDATSYTTTPMHRKGIAPLSPGWKPGILLLNERRVMGSKGFEPPFFCL